MPKLTIVRANESLNPKKNIYVYIDGNKIGPISPGKTLHYDLPQGKYKIVLRHKWAGGSQPIEVDMTDNGDKTIRMTTSKFGLPIAVLISVLINIGYTFIRIEFDLMKNLFLNLFIVLSLGALILLPLARHYYLKLEEVV